MNKYAFFVSIGFELIGLIIVAIYFGEKIETSYGHKKGLFQAIFIMLFLVGWLIRVILRVKQLATDKSDNKNKK